MINGRYILIQIVLLFFFFGTISIKAQNIEIGMGFFSPTTEVGEVLYLYDTPNHRKNTVAEQPIDSITFKNWYGNSEIDYAPNWFAPMHQKLDYGIFYIRVKRVGRDYHELVVNEKTGKTAYIESEAGKFVSWPEFLIGMHSIEFISEGQKVYDNPMITSAGKVYERPFFRALYIVGDWIEVIIIDNEGSGEIIRRGWIHWKKDGKLLIRWSLLS
ncbi:hypothetical protein [Ulvibacter antarcticus]|uniref:Uncharacterized protein n=1 Tax=Ulvibacter antarcticus TaxID=442714 RepID=A0A3L9YGX3_9FLAO|nr:hypothetical protein [Ulvibacter antarcticus]RMA58807.1 hypothetical protein BXY75_2186 [Ulvibacter antarcticus]